MTAPWPCERGGLADTSLRPQSLNRFRVLRGLGRFGSRAIDFEVRACTLQFQGAGGAEAQTGNCKPRLPGG